MNEHPHGTPARYKRGCRCDDCRDASNASRRHWTRMKAYGRWQPCYVDAGPARQHVLTLRDAGIGYRRVAVLAGVSVQTLKRLLHGHRGNPPSRKIRREAAEAILGVRPALDDLPARTPVDATGTVRRLRALAAGGWTGPQLAGLLGMSPRAPGVMMRYQDRVTAGTARAVRVLYDDLWMRRPPERSHREKLAASKARNYAAARGWVTGGWWDEEPGPHFIEDPAATPVPGAPAGRAAA